MLGNQAIATVIGLAPVIGDVGIAVYKTNFRNAALLEEYLCIRGEEFQKAQADRNEDPAVVKPGAGQEVAEKIPEKSPSQKLSFFRRSTKNGPAVADTPEGESQQTNARDSSKSNRGDKMKGKGKERSR